MRPRFSDRGKAINAGDGGPFEIRFNEAAIQ